MKTETLATPAEMPAGELTVAQLNAIDALVAGRNDAEAAALVGVHRVSVTRWRCYSPQFRAALAERRKAVWGSAADRLRALLPQALDVLADALADEANADRVQVALALLKLAGVPATPPPDPTEAAEYVKREVKREAAETPTAMSRILARSAGERDPDEHAGAVRARLERLAGETDGEGRTAAR